MAASYAAYVAVTWHRYGRIARTSRPDDENLLLDRFLPTYDVAERHQVRVAAPAAITLASAEHLELRQSAIIWAVFKGRELILRGQPHEPADTAGLIAQAKAWGWGVLAEIPNREIIFGAATQPWVANVIFRAIPPDEFAAFHEPEYVKIMWTLRVDPITATESLASTETRVATTDAVARRKFRRYWSLFSPGIILIRRIALRLIRVEAERRARKASSYKREDRYQES